MRCLSIMAVGTDDEIRSQNLYGDASNLVETRSPRYFKENIDALEEFVYNGRNLKASHTTAPGTAEQATESWTCHPDGSPYEHSDYRGNILAQLYHACCGRLQATIDRDGTSATIYNTDFLGQPTHEVVLSRSTSVSPVTNANALGANTSRSTSVSPVSNANALGANTNFHNPSNAKTLQEATTRFDARGRLLSIFHSQFSILNLAAGHIAITETRTHNAGFAIENGESKMDNACTYARCIIKVNALVSSYIFNSPLSIINWVADPLHRQQDSTKTAFLWWGDHEKTRRLVGFLDRSAATWPAGPKLREAGLSQCSEHSRSEAETDKSETTCPQGGAAINHQAGQATIQNELLSLRSRYVIMSPPPPSANQKSSYRRPAFWAHPTALNTIIARAVDGRKFKMEWYHKNYLDHVYAVSDDTGDILEHYRYTAFGQVEVYKPAGQKIANGAIDNPVRWNSCRYDEATQLYYYKYRHYIPKLGRWPSRDPIGEGGGINLYVAMSNELLARIDILGLECQAGSKKSNLDVSVGTFNGAQAVKMAKKEANCGDE